MLPLSCLSMTGAHLSPVPAGQLLGQRSKVLPVKAAYYLASLLHINPLISHFLSLVYTFPADTAALPMGNGEQRREKTAKVKSVFGENTSLEIFEKAQQASGAKEEEEEEHLSIFRLSCSFQRESGGLEKGAG